ncbi:hypothetical protein MKW92_025244 [Papaver armeniacum]|nr:hypothetical protein MKW92_025244 [Papaver armeniacum]
MVPSSIPEETISKNISSSIRRGIQIDNGFRNERCPSGTVPIRRTRKEDLVNAQYLLQKINSNRTNSYTLSLMNFHADSYRRTGCFNVLCPGFVQVSKKLFLGVIMHPVSVYGKELWEMSSKVYRDPKTGNWWLIISETIIGYWPKEIFTHLGKDLKHQLRRWEMDIYLNFRTI